MKPKLHCLKYLLAILTLSLLFVSATASQVSFEVYGTVTDSISGKGVSYVTLSIQNEEGVVKRLASDESGKFSFILDKHGTYDVIFHSVGYQLRKTSISLSEQNPKHDMGTVVLLPSNEEIGEVVVAVQKPLIRTEADKIVYSIESDPESKTSNVLEMLRKVPLITVDGEDNIQMRGSSNFKILMDGKTSTLVSQNPKDVLRSLPASSVRDIEVITDPSSKYEAEGTAGIINIITNKKQLEGFMGRLNAGVDSRGGFNGGIFATSKIKKFGFSVNYGYNKFKQPEGEQLSTRENFLSTENRFSESEGTNRYTGNMNFIRGEASYEIDTFNLVSLSYMGYSGNFSGKGLSTTTDYNLNRNITRQFENRINTGNEYGSLTGNIDYQRTFKKPDKTFTVSYRLDNSPRNTENENEVDGIINYPSYRQRTVNEATGREQTVQLDYYDPLTKVHQYELGIKYILRQNISNSDVFRLDDTGDWQRDLSRINDLDYDQHIMAAYFGYVLKLKKNNLKTGLRMESTKNDGLFKSVSDTTFTNRMFNLIPYINLSRNMENGQNVKLSYTQRLSRPGIWYLNPFYNDTDPLNVRYGNPKLDAEITHSISFAYGKFTPKYNFNLNLNSAFTNNSITSITRLQPNGVSVSTYENIGKNRNFGGNIYGSFNPGKKLNLNTNLGFLYSILESNNDLGLRNEGATYNGSLSVRYTAWKNGTFSVFGGLYSPRIMLQGKSSSYSYSNVSFSQQFFEKKLTASVSVNDPFRERMIFTNRMTDPNFTMTSKSYYYSRMFRVNISWQVGKLSEQIKKARRTISNEDLKGGGETQPGGSGVRDN